MFPCKPRSGDDNHRSDNDKPHAAMKSRMTSLEDVMTSLTLAMTSLVVTMTAIIVVAMTSEHRTVDDKPRSGNGKYCSDNDKRAS